MREVSGTTALAAGLLVALASCTSTKDSGGRSWVEDAPPLTVTLPDSAEIPAMLVQVGVVRAPDIAFLALVHHDPDSRSPRSDTPAGPVQGRRWVAVGSVSDLEYGVVHPGDPAVVRFGPERPEVDTGVVESVRPPGVRYPYSAEVAVRFQRSVGRRSERPQEVTVIVKPAGARDSLPAVPAFAIAQLPLGQAVFVPSGSGRYEVRWISTGPSVNGVRVLRGGLERGTVIAASGLAGLVDAARDSLERRLRRP